MRMKLRLTAALVLSALLAAGGAARAQQEEAKRLAPEEEREARDLAASLVRRFGETRDIAPLLGEFFVGDLAERLRAASPEEDGLHPAKFVAPDALARADAADVRRFYAAALNCYLLAEARGRVVAYTKNKDRREDEGAAEPGLRDYFPPEALAAARRSPVLARLIDEADDEDRPTETNDEATVSDEGGDAKFKPMGAETFLETTDVLEEVAAALRASLKSLPAEPLSRLFGENLPAGELAGEAEMEIEVDQLSDPFRGEEEDARIVCATARAFHVDLVRVEGRFRVLSVSADDGYKLRTDEQRRRDAGLAELFRAIESGDAETFERLLAEGASVNAKQPDGGWTPLHQAALHNRPDMLEMLIERGANVNAKNSHGNPVLSYALRSAAMTRALLEAGADPNVPDGQGNTALTVAAWHSDEEAREVVSLLKSFGARE